MHHSFMKYFTLVFACTYDRSTLNRFLLVRACSSLVYRIYSTSTWEVCPFDMVCARHVTYVRSVCTCMYMRCVYFEQVLVHRRHIACAALCHSKCLWCVHVMCLLWTGVCTLLTYHMHNTLSKSCFGLHLCTTNALYLLWAGVCSSWMYCIRSVCI